MSVEPLQALQAAQRASPSAARPQLLIAGATGALGNEVLRQLAGSSAFEHVQVLSREPIRAGLRGVRTQLVPSDDPATWPAASADVAVVMFDPPRLFYDRERALWTPAPEQLPALAGWLRRSGVRTVALVLPHAQGRLPEAVEQAVAALGFERLLIVRSAQKPAEEAPTNAAARLARFMLSVFKYMIPSSEQPVRGPVVARFVAAALQLAPPGIHVAPPELVWRAAQGAPREAVREWLGR